jgi:hypothetical protein
MTYLQICDCRRMLALITVLPGIILGTSGVVNLISPEKVNAKLVTSEIISTQSIEIDSLDKAKYNPNSLQGLTLTLNLPSFRRNIRREVPHPSAKPTEPKPRIDLAPRKTVVPPISNCPAKYPQSGAYRSRLKCPPTQQQIPSE